MAPDHAVDRSVAGIGTRLPLRSLILLADAFADRRQLDAEYLRDIGFDTDEAADGHQALRNIAARPPSVLVTDLVLPGIDGLELTRQVRARLATRSLPIILATAHVFPELDAQALRAGCNAVVVRPCGPEDLAVQIERLLGGRAGRMQVPPRVPSCPTCGRPIDDTAVLAHAACVENRRAPQICVVCREPLQTGDQAVVADDGLVHAGCHIASSDMGERVMEHLVQRRDRALCHSCLALALDVPLETIRKCVVGLRVQSAVVVEPGHCAQCRHPRVTVRAAASTPGG